MLRLFLESDSGVISGSQLCVDVESLIRRFSFSEVGTLRCQDVSVSHDHEDGAAPVRAFRIFTTELASVHVGLYPVASEAETPVFHVYIRSEVRSPESYLLCVLVTTAVASILRSPIQEWAVLDRAAADRLVEPSEVVIQLESVSRQTFSSSSRLFLSSFGSEWADWVRRGDTPR